MRTKLPLALLSIVALLWLPGAAVADWQWKTNSAIWKVRDACATQAQKAYPDYTPESNAKREKAFAACLRTNNLTPDGSSSPSPAPTSTPSPSPQK